MNLNERTIAVGILHDGVITSIVNHDKKLILKVHIQYLAEMINTRYEYFTYEFNNCHDTYFVYWNSETRVDVTNNLSDSYLEINETEHDGEYIKITCLCDKPGIKGGYLYIKADHLNIYDHEKNALTFEDMRIAAKKY